MTRGRAPVIGITGTEIQVQGSPPRLAQNLSYLRALVRAGAAPMLIPHLTDLSLLWVLYECCDGLLLPGGPDIHPACYGEPVHEKCRRISPERDETELALAHRAMDEGKPLLAICRGIQVLNVTLGGNLYQDLEAQLPDAERHDWHSNHPRDYLAHILTLSAGSRLAEIVGTTTLPVNSLHHQALKDIASGLNVVARAPDGVVEAVEAPAHPFALAVQWHPEELADEDARAQRLFDALVEAATF